MAPGETNNVHELSVAHGSNAKEVYQSLKHQKKEEGNNKNESKHSTWTDIRVICYMCKSKLVCGDDVVEHLLFSPLRCRFCKDMINYCSQLRDRCTSPCYCPARQKTFTHVYSDWLEPLEKLRYFIEMDLKISKYTSNVTLPLTPERIEVAVEIYLLSLLPLRELMPWKTAFKYFENHVPISPSSWPPPLPRLGWATCSENIAVQNEDRGIVDMPRNRQGSPDPHRTKVTHTSSQITVSVDNTNSSNTPSSGQQEIHQESIRSITREHPSLPFKTVKQSLPLNCPSSPTKINMETSADEVPSYKTSVAQITKKGKASGLISKCSSLINKNLYFQILEKPVMTVVHSLKRSISPDLYSNHTKFSSQLESQSIDTEHEPMNTTHHLTNSDLPDLNVTNKPDSKQPGIPKPVIIQGSNESDSHMTCLPNELQSEPTLTTESPNRSASDSRKSSSPEKHRKRRKRKQLWTKVKSRQKKNEVTSDEDDGTLNLKKMKFVTKEDLASKRFLVIQWPSQPFPEECPECSYNLTAVDITLNASNIRIGKVICPDCNLSIYMNKGS